MSPDSISQAQTDRVLQELRTAASTPLLRALAKHIGTNQPLAEEIWRSGVHDARVLAALIGDPQQITEAVMERWVLDLDSWDMCDACACCLFDKTPMAWSKALAWSRREEEFVKRAGFATMAALAVHDKQAADAKFKPFLRAIVREAQDDRHFVKKSVNWALRQIGKRNLTLNREAIAVARQLRSFESRSARWIAADALRELEGDAVQRRLLARGALSSRSSKTG